MTKKTFSADDLNGMFGQFEDMFGQFFGAKQSAKRGRDIQVDLAITLEEADAGTKRDIQYRRTRLTGATQATVAVKVPPGIEDRQILRIANHGDEKADGEPGHLYVLVTIKPRDGITRDGNDLKVSAEVRRKGGPVTVPCVHGDRVVDVPSGMKTGDTVVVPGCGMQIFGKPAQPMPGYERLADPYREAPQIAGRGNLIVTVRVTGWMQSLFR
ncbi:MAG: J domain-containing protein [Kofleriaceae bacterium]